MLRGDVEISFVSVKWSEMRRQMITALASMPVSGIQRFIILITPTAKVFGMARVNPSKRRTREGHWSGNFYGWGEER